MRDHNEDHNGKSLRGTEVRSMQECLECGSRLRETDGFCPGCGLRIHKFSSFPDHEDSWDDENEEYENDEDYEDEYDDGPFDEDYGDEYE